MAPILTSLKPLQSSLHQSAQSLSKDEYLGMKDICVKWNSLNVRGADPSQIILSTAVEINCHDEDKYYEFDIWLSRSLTKSLADMSQFLHIQHSRYPPFFIKQHTNTLN